MVVMREGIVFKQVAVGDWGHDYCEILWIGVALYLKGCQLLHVPRVKNIFYQFDAVTMVDSL